MARMKRYKFGQASVNRTWYWLLHGARRRGWQGYINGPRGGLRTYLQQAQLYALYRSGRGAPAFPPNGPSRHLIRNVKKKGQWSMAVDVTGAEQLIRIAENMGVRLHRPYPHEPWHVEAVKPFRCPKNYRP
jgi:hypothetical protein